MSFARTYSACYEGKRQEYEILNLPLLERKKNDTTEQLIDETFNVLQVEEELRSMKEENQSKRKSLEKRQERLLEKKCKLKESFVKFERYLRENNLKKERAEKKTFEEKAFSRNKNCDYIKLILEHDKLQSYKESVNALIGKRTKFKAFLTRFKEESAIFTTIDSAILHHKTLIQEQHNLMTANRENQLKLGELKTKLNKKFDSHKENMMLFNNQISQLSREYEAEHSRRMKVENTWNHICDTSSMKTLEIGKIKMVIHTIFTILKNTSNITCMSSDDYSAKLKTIGEYSQHMNNFLLEMEREHLANTFLRQLMKTRKILM